MSIVSKLYLVATLSAGTLLSASVAAAEPALTAEVRMLESIDKEGRAAPPKTTFAPAKLFCWSKVKGGKGKFKVTHVWIKDGKTKRRQPVNVRGKSWSTFSFFKVTPGAWKVEVRNDKAEVIGSTSFTVGK